jgi:hypothetical protein
MLELTKIERFFNIDQPCPADIPNCEQLREEFLNKLEELRKQGGCSPCKARGIRNHYLQIITGAYGAK